MQRLSANYTKGDVAEITEAGDTWTHVESGNVDGYVKNSYCVTGSEAYTYANDTFDTEVEIQTNGLRIRSSADRMRPCWQRYRRE